MTSVHSCSIVNCEFTIYASCKKQRSNRLDPTVETRLGDLISCLKRQTYSFHNVA